MSGPTTSSRLSGAFTGIEAQRTPEPARPPRWYARIRRGLRLKRGAGIGIDSDQHPDPTAEACRWQICEGELVQALGRARGVNRTAETPLDIDVLADVVLPIGVDQAVEWDAVPTGAEIEMLADGVVLESPSDMAACWPEHPALARPITLAAPAGVAAELIGVLVRRFGERQRRAQSPAGIGRRA